MALFDFIFGGGSKKKPAAGPHVTRQRQEGERQERLKEAETRNVASREKSAADDAARSAADAATKKAERDKKAKDFWGRVLKKK